MRHLASAVAALGLTTGVLIVLEAGLIAQIVARVYLGQGSDSALTARLIALWGVVMLRALVAGVAETLSLNLSTTVQSVIRQRLLTHVLEAGPLAWNHEHAGDLINTVITGVDHLEMFLARYLPQIALTAFVPLVIGIQVASTDWISAGLLLITLPLIPVFMTLIGRRAKTVTDRRFAHLGRLGAHFLDVVQGLETLKLFGQSQRQAKAIADAAETFRTSTMASLRLAFMSGMVLELLASLSMAMIAVAVGIRLLGGHIAFERAVFLLILVPDFYAPWRALGAKFHDGLNGLSASRTIYTWLDRPSLARGQGHRRLSGRGPWPLTLCDVGFTYPEYPAPALQGVHFSLPARRVLAIIGPSGSGKSTLLALLLGFSDPTRGEITVDSVPLAQLDRQWWRTQVAFIGQSPYLFFGTIADNLRMANPDADADRIAWALEKAHLDDTLKRFPHGLNTVIGENGVRLSGGERQRLALARAFLQARPFVVMDEPSAHLDSRTEQALLEGIGQLKQQSTVVLVTHRLASARVADRVLVLVNGAVAELGSPDHLTHPFYRQARAFAEREGTGEGGGSDALLG